MVLPFFAVLSNKFKTVTDRLPPLGAEGLRTIVYVSSASRLLDDAELEALLLDARAHNALHGVTGVLIYGEGNFMQCIEGPAHAIGLVFERILASRRHRDVITLMDEPIDDRGFTQWHMALAHCSGSELLRLSSAQWQTTLQQHRDDAPGACVGLQLLHTMWKELVHCSVPR